MAAIKAKSKGLSVIDTGITVEGTIRAHGRLVIAGAVEGTLLGDDVVTAKGSRVTARAEVDDLVIAGDFEGDVTARKSLTILRTGNFTGNIVCKTLSLEAGGRLNGHVEPMDTPQSTAPPQTELGTPLQTDHPSRTEKDIP
ncbi:MAG: polymer-forming cytoskeletal protein [Deltaproteobacteria bacterium]|nr:polymer-forming cytoskeletal protein [Deltaproteobacteria bacterium]